MKQRYLSLFVILTLMLALFAVTGIALAQEGEGDQSAPAAEEATDTPTEEPTAVPTEEPTVAPTEEPTVAPTEEPTVAPTEEPTVAPTEEPTVAPTEEPTVAPTEEPTVAPTVEPTVTITPTETVVAPPVIDSFVATPATLTDTTALTTTLTWAVTGADTLALNDEDVTGLTEKLVGVTETTTYTLKATNTGGSVEAVVVVEVALPVVEVAGEIEAQAALPGSSTSQIIAIANLNTSGSAETASLGLNKIASSDTGSVSSSPVYPGGGTFITCSSLPSDGEFSGILSSAFPAAAVVLNVNSTAKVADIYPGLSGNALAPVLYGTLIFNKHSNWESTFYCQNAGSSADTISVALYKTGEATPKVTLTSSSLSAGQGVKWDIADDATVQAAWAGGSGQFGYAKFSSNGGNNIACVVDNVRMTSPYVQSLFQAVPSTGYSSTDLRAPLVFNGHGTSSKNQKGLKWLSSVSFVNPDSNSSTVTVTYTAYNGYTNTCTDTVAGNSSKNWYAPEVGIAGNAFGNCTGGPLSWSYPGPTYGSVRVTATGSVLGIVNYARYDTGVGLGAGYSSLASSPSLATNRAVCPLAFNKNTSTDWVTGIQAANVGGSATNVSFKMVRAGGDPTVVGNSTTISINSVGVNSLGVAYFPEQGTALSNFEGAVFVEASDSNAKIVVSSSNTNYNTLGAAALYDCINY